MLVRKRVKKGPRSFPRWIFSLIIPLGWQNLLLCTTGYWWYRQMLVPGDQLILTEAPLKIREWGQILFQWKSGECLHLGKKKGEIYKHMRQEGKPTYDLQAGQGGQAWLGKVWGSSVPSVINQLIQFTIFTLKINLPLPKDIFWKLTLWAVIPSLHRVWLVIQHGELKRVEADRRCFLTNSLLSF